MAIEPWRGPGDACDDPPTGFGDDDRRDFAGATTSPALKQLLDTWRARSQGARQLGIAHCPWWFTDAWSLDIWEIVADDRCLSTESESLNGEPRGDRGETETERDWRSNRYVDDLVRDVPLAAVALNCYRDCRAEDVLSTVLGGLSTLEVVMLARVGDLVEVAIAGTNGGANAAWRLEGDTVRALTSADQSIAFDLFGPRYG